jgi:lipoprotein NlpI
LEAFHLSFQLHRYLERFPDICQKKFGRTYDFAALEKRFAYVRRGRRELVTKDVLALFDPNETPFAKYWGTPNEKDVDQALRRDILLGKRKRRLQNVTIKIDPLYLVSVILMPATVPVA